MMMKLKIPLVVLVGLSGPLSAAALFDDFSEGLGNWTATAVLDNSGGSNVSTFQVNGSGNLELETTAYSNVDQWAYIRSGATLAVGEEAQVTVSNWAISGTDNNESLGLYVGGSAPVTGTRADYISVYGKANNSGTVFQRGFNGGAEFPNDTQVGVTNVTKLFIARTDTNTFEWGHYDGAARNVEASVTPDNLANTADFVGIYADVRSVDTLAAISSFEIVPEPSSTLLLALGGLGLLRRRRN